ncbi:beta-ketoacyl synthase chain length factor [Neisseria sp. 23W00296]|uniref:beta-ketoacyl synthase chain length factor n=1 Tax=unclassified Neisseria TaxID=2623750 RepID=UPI0037576A4D
MHTACSFSFNIAAWHAACNRMATAEQWQQWAAGQLDADTLPEHKPALAFLPAMQRRRLGAAARLVCEAAWELADRYPGCPMVYASHDGEINRSFELWPELLRSHTVSPTSFGLSVHNAPAGQWSILRSDMNENTALAPLSDGLETALAEAFALLSDGAERVLVVVADDPLQTSYCVSAERAPFPHALAMVVEAGGRYSLTLQTGGADSERPSESAKPYYGALDWIRFLHSDGLEHTRHYTGRRWLWQKNA